MRFILGGRIGNQVLDQGTLYTIKGKSSVLKTDFSPWLPKHWQSSIHTLGRRLWGASATPLDCDYCKRKVLKTLTLEVLQETDLSLQ